MADRIETTERVHLTRLAALLVCPADGGTLELQGASALRCTRCGANFPVVDGVAVMLPDAGRRERIVGTDWSVMKPEKGDAISFYNQLAQKVDASYSRKGVRLEVEPWLGERRCEGLVLEIGSGNGDLQGIGGEDYAALDYGFTALRDYLDPKYVRVCATAEKLPFPDSSVSFIFTLDCLEHVPAADRAFDEIARVLKEGGVAFLKPAWHCLQYSCDGVPVRPYHELSLKNKAIKLFLPLISSKVMRGFSRMPGRILRRAFWRLGGRRPKPLRFKRLAAYYEKALCADSDACSSIDSHDACMYFASRGYEIFLPGESTLAQLATRGTPVVVRKPKPMG